jgi:mono/diheme cytochrome c family protein
MRINRDHLLAALIAICFLSALPQCSSQRSQPHTSSSAKDSVSNVDSAATASANAASMVLTYEQRQGKALFLKYCSVCHGVEGKGDGFNAFNLEPRPRDLSDKKYMSAFTEERLYHSIELGGRGMNKSPSMPSWGGRLNQQEMRYVVAYVQSMSAH